MRRIELERGERYNNLRYVRDAPDQVAPSGKRIRMALWKCDCGEYNIAQVGNVRGGVATSCGCKGTFPKRTHGLSRHPDRSLYVRWANMHARCYNENHPDYARYGGRGIRVCRSWFGDEGLIRFVEWAKANGYIKRLELDRCDNDKGYAPSNCQWVTRSENMLNTHRSKRYKS